MPTQSRRPDRDATVGSNGGPDGGLTAGSRRAALAAQRAAKERARRTNKIVTIVVAAVLAVVVITGIVVAVRSSNSVTPAATTGTGQGDAGLVVRDDSHRLSNPAGSKATFVEFLDFECEACRAAFPVVEQLRQQYGDQVTFVVRYFPIPSHFNAERAARAVEAAAQQGQFEAMYKKMYETQAQWGEQQVPMDDMFRQFAQQLGLDMAKWDAAYSSSETLARIKADVADGEKLGVSGTPTFFVNGQKLQPESPEQLRQALETAIQGK